MVSTSLISEALHMTASTQPSAPATVQATQMSLLLWLRSQQLHGGGGGGGGVCTGECGV